MHHLESSILSGIPISVKLVISGLRYQEVKKRRKIMGAWTLYKPHHIFYLIFSPKYLSASAHQICYTFFALLGPPENPVPSREYPKILEADSYVALVVVCSLGIFRLWQFHPQEASIALPSPVVAPTSVSGRVPVDLTTRKKWVILVLSTECHYCVESVPFHQELVKDLLNSHDVGLMALFPQGQQQVEKYEAAHDFRPNTVITDEAFCDPGYTCEQSCTGAYDAAREECRFGC